MNLHGIVAGLVAAVNPLVTASIQMSTGYTTNDDGRQVPTYAAPQVVQVQVQPLEWKELQQMEALNVQGERRAVYLPGNTWDGVSRVDQRGGDLLTFSEEPGGVTRTWLVVVLLEKWPDWVKVAVTLQNE